MKTNEMKSSMYKFIMRIKRPKRLIVENGGHPLIGRGGGGLNEIQGEDGRYIPFKVDHSRFLYLINSKWKCTMATSSSKYSPVHKRVKDLQTNYL